jgi:hypothetical protein
MPCSLIQDLSVMPTVHPDMRRFRAVPRHTAVQVDEWRQGNQRGQSKRRQRVCKVCSILRKENERPAETSWNCSNCKRKGVSVYMCQKTRRHYDGERRTCFGIWHKCWKNGRAIPDLRFTRSRPEGSAAVADGTDARPATKRARTRPE